MYFSFISGYISTSWHQPRPVALELGSVETKTEWATELIRGEGRLSVVETREEPATVLWVGVVTYNFIIIIS